MEAKEIIDNLKNKIDNNEKITMDEIMEIKKHDDELGRCWWVIILFLIMFCRDDFEKEDDDQCMEITTDITTRQGT